ncbi:hypothetical protein [Pelosinus sp. sgz500959]|uniref:hypothetical protein n=1 Tax=Pelosinus sp. sgz500959 TaxID=3242472 RepID=UPI00366EAEAC
MVDNKVQFWHYSGKTINKYCLKYGCILIEKALYKDKDDYFDIISTKMLPGDKVVMIDYLSDRSWKICAVGEVEGGYDHHLVFQDLLGLDMQHARKVIWKINPSDEMITYEGGFRHCFLGRIGQANPNVWNEIWEIIKNGVAVKQEDLPDTPMILSDQDIINRLIINEISLNTATRFINIMNVVRNKCKWYMEKRVQITEQQTIVYLISPILDALEWSDTHIRYQYCNADAGFFTTKNFTCFRIMEVKPLGHPLTKCIEEGIRHAKVLRGVEELIVTNGHKFLLIKLSTNPKEGWYISSCLNILSPIDEYTMGSEGGREVGGAVVFIMEMLRKEVNLK